MDKKELTAQIMLLLRKFASEHADAGNPETFDDMLFALCCGIGEVKKTVQKQFKLPDKEFWEVVRQLADSRAKKRARNMN